MTTIHTILDRVRRIRQQRAELFVYAERVEAIEQAEPFDHPTWQGVTDEEGWLKDDLTDNLDHLLSDASAMTKPVGCQSYCTECHTHCAKFGKAIALVKLAWCRSPPMLYDVVAVLGVDFWTSLFCPTRIFR